MKCSLASPPQKPGKRERWVFNVSNANKKVKVGQDEVKFGSEHEKEGECSNEKSSGEVNVASSNVKKAVAGSSADASRCLYKYSSF